jgi:hypothetical protein
MKPGLFSFIGDEFENVFQYSDLFLPGIAKIAGIYYSASERRICILSRTKNEPVEDHYDEVLQKRENLIMIQKFRSEYQQFSWIKKSDLPFELPDPQQKLSVPTLFSELENIILVLRFNNESDKLFDLLLIYFNQNLGNFGLNKSDKILTTDHKAIIGHLLYYQFKSFLQLNLANRRLLQRLNHGVKAVISDNQTLRDSLNQVQSSYGDSMVNIALDHLSGLSNEYGRSYILTEESQDKIRAFKGNLKHLPKILENAVIFTENLLLSPENEAVKIQSYSLDFDSYQVDDQKDLSARKIDSRESRAMQLLDKLERSAKMLKSRNIPIISSNVGKEMDPSITAPAITDALGKNRVFIRLLLEKYPEKWEIIRSDFKPLLNQLSKVDPADLIQDESA